jgi:hypothetical protein
MMRPFGSEGMKRFRQALLAAVFAVLPGVALGFTEQSLLTTDGTLHVVRSGSAVELGLQDVAIDPDNSLIEWSARSQDGTVSTAIIPGTDSHTAKTGIQVAFDDQTQTLLLLWTENISAMSQIRIGVLHGGVWTNSGLLPNQGISRAYNPQMRLSHYPITYLDADDQPVSKSSSLLSIIWWEEAQYGQARLATLFLDEENFDPASLAVYDLPALTGDDGADTSLDGIPSGAYLFPSLQPDGLSGAVLASFADLHEQRHKIVRVEFPSDQGKPSEPGNLKWQRRHIPIVGVATQGPIARMTPILAAGPGTGPAVGTTIGAGYLPTLYWRDGANLKYTRLGQTDWTPVRSIAIDETMPYDRALSLVVGMAERN